MSWVIRLDEKRVLFSHYDCIDAEENHDGHTDAIPAKLRKSRRPYRLAIHEITHAMASQLTPPLLG
jgi:hypothetical protein